MLEGRAWDTGLENLWVHVDSEGAIDWVGVVDPTLRALPDDPVFGDRGRMGDGNAVRDGIVALPNEAALTTWIAHRSHRALEPLFGRLAEISGGAMSIASMWHIVGVAVVAAATHVPLLAGSSEMTSMRRGQAVLDALVGLRPAGPRQHQGGRGEGLAKLGQPCLSYEGVRNLYHRTEPES